MNTKLVILCLSFVIFLIYFLTVFTSNDEHFTDNENFNNISRINEKLTLNEKNLKSQLQEYLTNNTETTKEPETFTPNSSPLAPYSENFNTYGVPAQRTERFQSMSMSNSDDIQLMVTKLNNVEEACKRFEESINERDEQTGEKIREYMKRQLDKEDEKIQELEELVSVFRQQYFMKEAINNRCTNEKQKQIDSEIKNIKDNEENFLDQSQEVNLNLSKSVSKALVNTLKETHKKKRTFIPTDTDDESPQTTKK